ncbi:type II toxin-antitoxin system PemK/MazF family toxin [Levilactobacillus brevis]|uniref:type II toxin-antitoxin system PemK/MazF family toxin n=1 Tax=Levilactobacillus brevis TaxID=1580 RepID=UPI0021A91ED2|nr:type II toxin-antitoxin system PemK/MazF family toxin [Levilactobacillus brevis]
MNNSVNLFHLMDIAIADVPYDDGKTLKTRPALLVSIDRQQVTVFKITTKYEEKSEAIKKFYYPIEFWCEAGLDKASFVDTHMTYTLATEFMLKNPPIGVLTDTDVIKLFNFIKTNQKDSV